MLSNPQACVAACQDTCYSISGHLLLPFFFFEPCTQQSSMWNDFWRCTSCLQPLAPHVGLLTCSHLALRAAVCTWWLSSRTRTGGSCATTRGSARGEGPEHLFAAGMMRQPVLGDCWHDVPCLSWELQRFFAPHRACTHLQVETGVHGAGSGCRRVWRGCAACLGCSLSLLSS